MRISEYRTNDDEPLPLLPLYCGSLVLFFSRYWHRVLYRDLCGPSACIMCCCWLPGGVSLLGPAQHKLCSVLLLSLQGFLRKAVWLCFCPFFFFFLSSLFGCEIPLYGWIQARSLYAPLLLAKPRSPADLLCAGQAIR